MAIDTARDRVWIKVLENFLDLEFGVTPEAISNETGVSERTARDCLQTMHEEELVEKERIPNGRVRYSPSGILDVEESGEN